MENKPPIPISEVSTSVPSPTSSSQPICFVTKSFNILFIFLRTLIGGWRQICQVYSVSKVEINDDKLGCVRDGTSVVKPSG